MFNQTKHCFQISHNCAFQTALDGNLEPTISVLYCMFSRGNKLWYSSLHVQNLAKPVHGNN